MNDNENIQCKHKYIIGYSLRKPQPFFRSLPCDNCGCGIKLSLPWRIIYLAADFSCYIFAFGVSTSIHIKFLGSTFFVSVFAFILIIAIIQPIIGLIFKYGKWIKVDKK